MNLSDKTYRILQYTGNPSQVFSVRRMTYEDGPESGLSAIEVTSGDIGMTVLPGRGLNIARLSWKGINLSFLSKAGLFNAAFCDRIGGEGINTFYGGFLTTCGLKNVGVPDICDGEDFGFHGRIDTFPASEVCAERSLSGDTPVITISGKTRESRLFGSSLELYRTITLEYGKPEIHIHDVITNLSALPESVALLYHFNMGYPLLDENARFVTTHKFQMPVDENAEKRINDRYGFLAPAAGAPENCFFYEQRAGENGEAFGACVNEPLGIGVAICSDPSELPYLCNWQSFTAGDYAMGIEPCTCHCDGRTANRERGELTDIPAYGSKEVSLSVRLLDNSAIKELLPLGRED